MDNILIFNLNERKPFELMTPEERDEHFLENFGKTYDEFCKEVEEQKGEPTDISNLIKKEKCSSFIRNIFIPHNKH